MSLVHTGVLVLDCQDPARLAEFYEALLGGEVVVAPGGERADVTGERGTRMAFRRDPAAAPSSWPRPEDAQQAHLDLLTAPEDLDEAERRIVELGARPLRTRDAPGPHEARLYADPAGHPFTLRPA
ncbi:VOC family protein [Streptomyces sp. NPDC059524]|uniref:VOC family protein n=1 Tax=Streptomyces sp. NPDC059524 TaxID=3346856 RepID=UPI0036A085BA